MLESQITVASVRLLGGAEIVIKRIERIHPESQRQKPESLFKAQQKQKLAIQKESSTVSLAKNGHAPNNTTNAVVVSIGETATFDASTPYINPYSTGLQVEFYPSQKGTATSTPTSLGTDATLTPRQGRALTTLPRSLQEKGLGKQGTNKTPSKLYNPHYAVVGGAWVKEKQPLKAFEASEVPLPTLDVHA